VSDNVSLPTQGLSDAGTPAPRPPSGRRRRRRETPGTEDAKPRADERLRPAPIRRDEASTLDTVTSTDEFATARNDADPKTRTDPEVGRRTVDPGIVPVVAAEPAVTGDRNASAPQSTLQVRATPEPDVTVGSHVDLSDRVGIDPQPASMAFPFSGAAPQPSPQRTDVEVHIGRLEIEVRSPTERRPARAAAATAPRTGRFDGITAARRFQDRRWY
jgi:hypothetical protein